MSFARAFCDVLEIVFLYFKSVILTFVPYRFLPKKDVRDQIVLITGGGSGIGRELAVRFAKLGSTVVLWDVNEAGMTETRRRISAESGESKPTSQYVVDVSNFETVKSAASRVKTEVGSVDVLINNAGIVMGKTIMDLTPEQITLNFNVNLLAHFWTIKAFLPDMKRANRGHLVYISSVGGLAGSGQMSDYCAAKFGVLGLAESVHAELRGEGLSEIYTTAVCPYFINTGMFDGVKSKLINIQDPTYVANHIVNAVLTNERIVMIPRMIVYLNMLKAVLPVDAYEVMYRLLGGYEVMQEFTGRNQKVKNN